MLLSLFIALTLLSLSLVWLSYYSKEALYSLAGFFFLFLLSISALIPGSLQVVTGQNTTITYTSVNGTIVPLQETSVDTYTNFTASTSRTFGIWLIIMSCFGIAITIFEMKKGQTL